MFRLQLESNQVFYDLYALTGIAIGTSLIVTNNTGSQIRLTSKSDTMPTDKLAGYPVWPNQTVLVHGNDVNPVWVKGGTDGYVFVQELTSTVTPFVGIDLPQDIVTSGVESFRRLQVDPGQTGFFEAREFRAIRKIRLATGERQVFKFVANVEFILAELKFTISSGNYEAHIWDESNVTETVASTTPIPIFNKNDSQIEYRRYNGLKYQTQIDIFTGGSITVIDTNLYRDYVELITSNATAQRSTVTAGSGAQRYTPAITFYVEVFAITGPVRGTITGSWEERPPGVK